jgi:hypothetical protein
VGEGGFRLDFSGGGGGEEVMGDCFGGVGSSLLIGFGEARGGGGGD